MEMIRLFFIGIAVGIANVIPGVSGGTLAVVFNIYDKFVNAITFNIKKLIENRKFIIPLILGMLSGILLFSKIITILYEHYPLQTNYFFTGLVIGSLPLLFRFMIKKEETNFSVKKIISIIICAIIGFAILMTFNYLETIFDKSSIEKIILPEIHPTLLFRIFIAGILGAIAMIIPGISGSLLMLMMGVYQIIICAIPSLFVKDDFFHALFLLLPNGIGVLLGLVFGAKLISFLIKKVPNQTYAVIFGLIFGSIFSVFPGFSELNSVLPIISSILCLLAGFSLAYFSSKSTEN